MVAALLFFALLGVVAAVSLMVLRMRRTDRIIPGVTAAERFAWTGLACALIGTSASASVLYVGPLILTDANGSTQITVGSGSSSAAAGANSYLTFARGGLVFTDTATTTTTWGDFSGPPLYSTGSISVTFATAEPDTNYRILLSTTGTSVTNTGVPFRVGARYTSSFQVLNPAHHNNDITGTFFKFRTTTP